jgi:hypothetical protein
MQSLTSDPHSELRGRFLGVNVRAEVFGMSLYDAHMFYAHAVSPWR